MLAGKKTACHLVFNGFGAISEIPYITLDILQISIEIGLGALKIR